MKAWNNIDWTHMHRESKDAVLDWTRNLEEWEELLPEFFDERMIDSPPIAIANENHMFDAQLLG